MPYVNIQVTDEGVTKAQKAALIHGVAKLLKDVLNKDPSMTFVVIEEIGLDNWGTCGEQVSERRLRGAKLVNVEPEAV